MKRFVVRVVWTAVVVMALGAVAFAPQPSWAFDAFLKISDCQGPETRKAFVGQIHLSGFASSVQIPVTTLREGGGGSTMVTGSPKLSPIEVLKELDRCSPQIFRDAVAGTRIPEALISFVRTTPTGLEQVYFRIKLTDVQIIGVDSSTIARQGQNDARNIEDASRSSLNTGSPIGVQEVVKLLYRRIELTDVLSGQTVSFDLRTE